MNLEKFLELQYKDKKNNFNYNSNNLIQIFNLLSISAIEISKIFQILNKVNFQIKVVLLIQMEMKLKT